MSSRKARIGFIGAGWWATDYQMPYFATREDVELVGVCRLGRDELALVRDRFGFKHATEDFRELVQLDLDAVVVASPHVAHFEHARAALEAGKHVMVEKPMCTTARDARALAHIARERGLHVLVPQGWNFAPYVREASRLVRAGEIGEPRHIVCQMASALSDLMGGRPMVDASRATFTPPASTWADPARAGGFGWGQLTHGLGVMFALADVQPEAVFAWMGRSPSGADYYDAISAHFTNGATAAISGSATIPKPAGAQNDRGKGYQIDVRVFGSAGMLLLDVERERLEIRRDDGRNTVVPLQPGEGDYPASLPWAAFVDLVLGRTMENAAPAALNVRVVELLEAAYRSASAGGKVINVADL